MNQREFLVEFEKLCGVNKPVFLDTSDTWQIRDSDLVFARDLKTEHSIGRQRLSFRNSQVCELWIDVDNHEAMPFKQYKEEKVVTALQKLNSLGIPNDCIFPKVSGRGIHLHVFITDLPANVDVNELFEKTTPDSADPRSAVEKQKVREYGAAASTGKGFTGWVAIDALLKAKALPTFKEPEYPKLKLFQCNADFLFRLSLVKEDNAQGKMEHEPIVDFERDGDYTQLFNCPLMVKLERKAKVDHHLKHDERVFLMTQLIHFGKDSRKRLHAIMSHCSDYDQQFTQGFIDHAIQNGYHPETCDRARQLKLGCPEHCKGSGGKSPIKFAWKPMSIDELHAEYRKVLLLAPEDDVVLDLLLAAMLDPRVEGELAWIFLIAPAASGKTVIIKSLHNPAWSRLEDSITPQTFISGKTYKDKQTGEDRLVEGLLPKMDGKTLLIKEFTTELMHGEEIRNDVFGQLRAIHDRYFSKTFGSIDIDKIPEKWKHVKMGFIAGCVPYIDRYSTLNVLLGERYLKLRLKQPPRIDAGEQSIFNSSKVEKMQEQLTKKVTRFIANMKIPKDINEQDPPQEYVKPLVCLAEVIVQCRKPVTATQGSLGIKIYDYEDQTELPTRVVAQLWKLGRMLQVVYNEKFNRKMYDALIRVALDTIPQERIGIIMHLYNCKEPQSKTRIADVLKWDHRKVYEHIKQMSYVGIVHTDNNDDYYLDEYIRTCITTANIVRKVKTGTMQDVCTITVTHSRPTLYTKDHHYGKVHQNRESVGVPKIPSKLNYSTKCDNFDYSTKCASCAAMCSCQKPALRCTLMHFVMKCASHRCNRPSPYYPMTRWCSECLRAGRYLYWGDVSPCC